MSRGTFLLDWIGAFYCCGSNFGYAVCPAVVNLTREMGKMPFFIVFFVKDMGKLGSDISKTVVFWFSTFGILPEGVL